MNLVRFLLIGCFMAIALGEFGKFPFGNVGNSLSLLDIVIGLTGGFFLIWKIAVKRQLDYPRIYYGLVGFILIGLAALLINQNFSGLLYLIRFIFYSLIFWVSFSLAKDDPAKTERLQLLAFSFGLIVAVIGFAQLIFFPNLTRLTDFGYDPHIFRLVSTFLDPNFLAAFLSFTYMMGIVFYLQSKRPLYLLFLALLFVAIILTFSRSGWIMLGIINLFAIWFLPRKIIATLLLGCILMIALVPRIQQRIVGAFSIDMSASERFGSWAKGFELFKENPIVGIGFNNIRSVSIEKDLVKPFSIDGGNSGSGVDSSWLLILATTGIAGFISFSIFYLGLITIFLKKYFQNHEKKYFILTGTLIGFLLESQFINSLFYPPLMITLFFITGSFYARISQDN